MDAWHTYITLVIKNFLRKLTESKDDISYKKYGNKTDETLPMEYHPKSIAFLCDELYFMCNQSSRS